MYVTSGLQYSETYCHNVEESPILELMQSLTLRISLCRVCVCMRESACMRDQFCFTRLCVRCVCHRLGMSSINSCHCVTNVNPRVSPESAQRTFSRGWSRHEQVETLRSQLKGQMTISGLARAHDAGNDQ